MGDPESDDNYYFYYNDGDELKFLNNDGRVIKEEKVPAGQWYTIYNYNFY